MNKKVKTLIMLLILIMVFPSNLISAQNLLTKTTDSHEITESTVESSEQIIEEENSTTESIENVQDENLQNIEPADVKMGDEVVIHPGNVVYPTGTDYVVATVDWFDYNLNIDLPYMDSGESMTLSLGPEWATSENIFEVNGYLFTPSGDGKFTIMALTDKLSGNLSLDLSLRYRENIQDDEESIPITPKIDYKGVIYGGDPTLVEVKKYKDNIPPEELIKKEALGKDKDGNAVWRMFVNYNRESLQGKEFIFKDTPSNGQEIISSSILVYDVQETKNDDGSRNLEHDDYNYWLSYLLQNSVTSNGDIVLHSTGKDDNSVLYSGQPYYVYYKTEIPKGVPDEDVKNTVSIEIQDGSGRSESSTSGLSSTPSSGGSGSTVDSKINVDVTKQWDDENNQDGKRPDSIKVQLYADDVAVGSPVTLSETSNWTYQWTELAEYNSQGDKITYTVKEVEVPIDYTETVTKKATNDWVITNSHTPETIDISGTKTWNDGNNKYGQRPNSIEISLYGDGKLISTMNTDELLNWNYQFTGLPKYKNGEEIKYEVKETPVPGYNTRIKGFNIENTYILGKTDFTVTKEWDDKNNQDGKRPDSIKVQLYGDGVAVGSPVTLSKTSNWTYQWTELAEYNSQGDKITYTVKEVNVPSGYTVVVTPVNQNTVVITNSYQPTVTVPGTGGSGSGNRPDLPKTGSSGVGKSDANNLNDTNSTKRNLPRTGEKTDLYLVNIGMFIVLLAFLRYLFKYIEQQNMNQL